MNESVQFFIDEMKASEMAGESRDPQRVALAFIVAQITDMSDTIKEMYKLLKQQEKQ